VLWCEIYFKELITKLWRLASPNLWVEDLGRAKISVQVLRPPAGSVASCSGGVGESFILFKFSRNKIRLLPHYGGESSLLKDY
jgi:hypothetical protein